MRMLVGGRVFVLRNSLYKKFYYFSATFFYLSLLSVLCISFLILLQENGKKNRQKSIESHRRLGLQTFTPNNLYSIFHRHPAHTIITTTATTIIMQKHKKRIHPRLHSLYIRMTAYLLCIRCILDIYIYRYVCSMYKFFVGSFGLEYNLCIRSTLGDGWSFHSGEYNHQSLIYFNDSFLAQ